MLTKKGNAAVVVLIIIIIILVIVWIIEATNRGECHSDKDCGEGYYCDVHHDCKAIPIIEKNISIVEKHYNFMIPSLIIALTLIIGVFILRYKKDEEEAERQEAPNVYKEIRIPKINKNLRYVIFGIVLCIILILIL